MAMAKRPLQLFKFSPVLVAGAYAAGNVVGVPVLLTNVMEDSSAAAILNSISIASKVATALDLEVHFFTDTLAGPPTPGADKGAFTLAAADVSRWVGMVKVAAADYAGTTTGGALVTKGNLFAMIGSKPTPVIPGSMVSYRNLYAVVVARGAYVAVSASDLAIILGVEQG